MSLDEIAYWLKRLIEEPALGWSRDLKPLAHLLGFQFTYAIRNRAYGKVRMTKPEQKRVAEALADIIDGRIVCDRRLRAGRIRGEPHFCEHPVPLHRPQMRTGYISVTRKGVKLSLQAPKTPVFVPKMPSFKEILSGRP